MSQMKPSIQQNNKKKFSPGDWAFLIILVSVIFCITTFLLNQTLFSLFSVISGFIVAFILFRLQFIKQESSLLLSRLRTFVDWLRKKVIMPLITLRGKKDDKADLLISYVNADTIWAEWIIYVLKYNGGYNIVSFEWNGNNFKNHMHMADQRASYTILIWSPAYSKFLVKELQGRKEFERQNQPGKRLIPIPLYTTNLQVPLAINLELDEASARDQLVKNVGVILKKTPQRISGKLPKKPLFPGSGWNIPRQYVPCSYFTGYEEQLDELKTAFIEAENVAQFVQSRVIVGPHEIGKTQIAIEYAYKYRSYYQYVFWIDASSKEKLLEDYKQIAKIVKLQYSSDQELADRVKRWLEEGRAKVLAIYDHCDKGVINAFIPRQARSHIVLTSSVALPGWMPVKVTGLKPDDGARLLLHYAYPDRQSFQKEDLFKAKDISKEVEGNPSAILVMASYIHVTGHGVSKCLKSLKETENRDELLQYQESSSSRSIAASWLMLFNEIEKKPEAAQLLVICALLAHGKNSEIPLKIIVEVFDQDVALNSSHSITSYLDELITFLREYSLVNRNNGNEQVNRQETLNIVTRSKKQETLSTFKIPDTPKNDKKQETLSIPSLLKMVLRDIKMRNNDIQTCERVRKVANAIIRTRPDDFQELKMHMEYAEACANFILDNSMEFNEAVELLYIVGDYKMQWGEDDAQKYLDRAREIIEKPGGQKP